MYFFLDFLCYKEIYVRKKKKKGQLMIIIGFLVIEVEIFDLIYDNVII